MLEELLKKSTGRKRKYTHSLDNVKNPDDPRILRFTICNVRSGLVADILNDEVSRWLTLQAGKILSISKEELVVNNSKKIRFGIHAEWDASPYSPMSTSKIKIGEALKQSAKVFINITRYEKCTPRIGKVERKNKELFSVI